MARTTRITCTALAVLAAATAAAPVDAQYFGRNKVQYETFDFRVLRSEHFDLHYYPSAAQPSLDAAIMAERWYTRLAGVLSHEILSRQPVILYADHSDFQQTNVVDGEIDESTGGVTESMQRRVVMPITPTYRETQHVLGHELVHAFQYDLAARAGSVSRLNQLPLWAVEGMAEYLSVGRQDAHTAMWLRDAVLHDDVPTLRKLSSDPRYFPYRFGEAVWAYIGGRWGDERVGELFVAALRDGWNGATARVLAMHSDTLSRQWVDDVTATYSPLIEGRTRPDAVGRMIGITDGEPGEMMLGPAISPDGRHIAFVGARDFSLDLYLLDVETGRIARRLARGSADAHFDAISYTGSAGAWSPDGSQFAAVVFAGGNQEIAIIDVATARMEKRVRLPRVSSIASPTWSPDGRSIAFSGMSGGVSDLYLIDIASSSVRQLTADRYADLQPVWAPDGRSLAFVTDRADSARYALLEMTTMSIATIDLATGATRDLALMPGTDAINPHFSPDGTSIYFLAAPDGFRDIYRADLGSGELFRVTRVATGITGLTSLSPALSVATKSGDVGYSIFNRRGYVLGVIAAADTRGTRVDAPLIAADDRAGILLPLDANGRVDRYLADAHTGMPDSTQFENTEYAARPKLSYIGMPSLGVGIDQFGVGVYANLSGYFTDVLGNHSIFAQAVVNGGWKDVGGSLGYQSRGSRLNWSLSAGHIPYVSRFANAVPVLVEVDGQAVVATAFDEYRERLTVDHGMGALSYPLSATRRIELSGGLSRIRYGIEIERAVQLGNRTVSRQKFEPFGAVDYTLWQGGVALVGDHSTFGIASPIDGGRYRFAVEPTRGTLDFVTAVADWRQYRYRRPVTFAVRAMHYGRYGADADRPELGTLFLGTPGMVRGYSYGSFDGADCTRTTTSACPQLQRLLGSSLAVASVELRAPLIGNDRFGLLDFGFLPTEIALFADAGAAWSRAQPFSFNDDERGGPVYSAGISTRFNLAGMFIIETYYAKPFQRNTGGRFGVQLVPGW